LALPKSLLVLTAPRLRKRAEAASANALALPSSQRLRSLLPPGHSFRGRGSERDFRNGAGRRRLTLLM